MTSDATRDRRIQVVVCFDRNVDPAVRVLIESLRRQATRERPITLHAITSAAADDLLDSAAGDDAALFEIHPITVENRYAALHFRGHISAATYLRLLIPDLLAHLDKVLYVDIDVVFGRPLGALYDTDLGEAVVAAVPDHYFLNGRAMWENWHPLYEDRYYDIAAYIREVVEIDPAGANPYFNCGVLLLNLAAWRERRVVERTLGFLDRKPRLLFMDQDALNHVIAGDYVVVDPRWNVFAVAAHADRPRGRDLVSRRAWDWRAIRAQWSRDPWIAHFAGPHKPWSPRDVPTPLDHLWWEIAVTLQGGEAIRAAYVEACTAAGRGLEKIPPHLR